MFKALITDLDNTLLRRDKSVSDYTRGVLERCRRRGILVMAASARPERTIIEFRLGIEFDAVATLNGARILLPGGVLENSIPRGTGELILGRLKALPGAVISAETSGGIFSNLPIPEWNSAVLPDIARLPGGTLYKLLVSGPAEPQVRAVLTGDTYCTPIENGKLWQIMSRQATKWNAVLELLAAFGLTPADAAYFGDDYDDIEPVRRCGLGVAVANAIPEVRAAADIIAADCDEDGPARFIDSEIL